MSAWANATGYISTERTTHALLINEHRSVQTLFTTLVCQSFTKGIGIVQPDGTYRLYPPGARPWGLRALAEAAHMAVDTCRKGLKRLSKLGLITVDSSKRGTVVQVLKFFQYQKTNPNISAPWQPLIPPPLTRCGSTRVLTIDPYRSPLNKIPTKITSLVAVQAPSVIECWVKPGDETGNRILQMIRETRNRI